MVACHYLGIGLVTRFPVTAPASTHFFGGHALRRALPTSPYGCTPQHQHRLGYPIPHHGTRYLTIPRRLHAQACAPHFTSRLRATASTSALSPGSPLWHSLPLHLTVARHGIGIGLGTRFPVTAPTTSQLLGGHGLGPPLLPLPPPPPPPPHGRVPRHRHRLGSPTPCHGTS
jgi:hypothetical protein